MDTPVIEKVVEQLRNLPHELQWRVLEFTRALALSVPRGVSGRKLLRFAGAIPSEEVQRMSDAIEQGCEQIQSVSGNWVEMPLQRFCRQIPRDGSKQVDTLEPFRN